jgi:hypothetical protein
MYNPCMASWCPQKQNIAVLLHLPQLFTNARMISEPYLTCNVFQKHHNVPHPFISTMQHVYRRFPFITDGIHNGTKRDRDEIC